MEREYRAKLEKDLKAIDTKCDRLLDMSLEGSITRDQYGKKVDELKTTRLELSRQLGDCRKTIRQAEITQKKRNSLETFVV